MIDLNIKLGNKMKDSLIIILSALLTVSCKVNTIQNQPNSSNKKTTLQKVVNVDTKPSIPTEVDSVDSVDSVNSDLEKTIISVIKAYQSKDEKKLNRLINPEFGIAFLYKRGVHDNLSIEKSISFAEPTPEYLPYSNEIDTDYKIRISTLPFFNCNTENWDKPPGIYIDTINTDHLLSETAISENNLFIEKIWSDLQIEELKNLENNSHKIILFDKNKKDFIFYLTKVNDKWFLSAIDRNEVCSA
ncbi:MAG: hypothetical protein C4K58_00405 [Flavobacteriaceae bacterium]|nr:MAG: hypothetical protein C4K58_00405 [Flavobacteriaceae bacterium]